MRSTTAARTALNLPAAVARRRTRSTADDVSLRPRARRRLTTTVEQRNKIDALPFVLDRERAIASMLGVVTGHRLTQSAQSKGALSAVFALAKAVVMGQAGGRFALVRCQAVYIPIWHVGDDCARSDVARRVDIAARWLASSAFLAGVKMQALPDADTPEGRFARLMTSAARVPVNVRTSCFALPGHSWSPLSQLPLHLPIEDEGEIALERFDAVKHGRTKDGEEIAILPFSQSPFGLLDRVHDYCRSHAGSTDELRQGRKIELQDYLDGKESLPDPIRNAAADEADAEEVDPDAAPTVPALQSLLRRMRPLDFAAPLYAAYPILVPAFLGEFKERANPANRMSLEEDASAADEDGPRVTAIALAHVNEIRVRGLSGGFSNVHSSTAVFDGEHWMPRTSPMPTIVAGVPQQPDAAFNALFDGAMTLAPQHMDKTPGLDHPRAMSFREHHALNLAFAEQEQQIAASMLGTAEMEMDEDEEAYELKMAEQAEKIDSIRPEWLRKLTRSGDASV